MFLNRMSELLHVSVESVEPSVSPMEANDKADDILDVLEHANAPSEALRISSEIDTLLSAAIALNKLDNSTIVTDENANEVTQLSKDVISTTIPATTEVDISLESVVNQLKHVVNKIKEMIKQFFLAIGRTYGFWHTRVMIVLKGLDKSEQLLKAHIKQNGNTRVNSTLSTLDMNWHQTFNSMRGKAELVSTPAASLSSQTSTWITRRELAIKTCKNIAKNVSAAETSEAVAEELNRLQYSANPVESQRLFLSLLGGKVITTDPHRFVFEVNDNSVDVLPETTHYVDTSALLKMIVAFKEAGHSLLKMELEAERDNAMLETLYLHIANKAEYNNSDTIRRALGRLKEATFKVFRGDAATIDSFIHLSNIYIRKVNAIK